MSDEQSMFNRTAAAMAANFSVSVSVVWLNKFVYMGGFRYNMTMTALHFFVTYLGLEICALIGCFERKFIPVKKVLPISLAFCGFVVFNNLSLEHNLVGVYQLWKVMTTPMIPVIQLLFYDVKFTSTELLALVPVCVGVITATSSELQSNFVGTVFALLGLVSTSMYQIWVKTEQKDLELSPWQLLYLQAPTSCAVLLCLTPLLEDVRGMLAKEYEPITLLALAGTAVLAFLVNLSIFFVIRYSSPLSYNVLGHTKLVAILLSGFFLFGEEASNKKIFGACLTLAGVFCYTYIQLTKPKAPPVTKKKE
jgi:solute carrier family 35 protein E3